MKTEKLFKIIDYVVVIVSAVGKFVKWLAKVPHQSKKDNLPNGSDVV